ncbi:MAG TPA: hypothetical protein VK906_01920 [Egicoccus sp.]|nr:hypothetical protein [Egicoccus sp.]HSK21899.1 hypothetical protein [Egicoccus sp.]
MTSPSASGVCPECGEPLAPAPAPGREATVGTVAGGIEQLPRWRCPHGHDAGPVLTADRARDEVAAGVAVARRRRLRGGDVCVACGSALTMPVRRTVWPVTLTDPDRRSAITLTYDVPATRCPDCGQNQVPTRSADDLAAVLDELLREPDGR